MSLDNPDILKLRRRLYEVAERFRSCDMFYKNQLELHEKTFFNIFGKLLGELDRGIGYYSRAQTDDTRRKIINKISGLLEEVEQFLESIKEEVWRNDE